MLKLATYLNGQSRLALTGYLHVSPSCYTYYNLSGNRIFARSVPGSFVTNIVSENRSDSLNLDDSASLKVLFIIERLYTYIDKNLLFTHCVKGLPEQASNCETHTSTRRIYS